MKTSLKVSIGGVVAALSLALMLLCSVIPFGTVAFPCFAGIFLVVLVIELGYSYSFGVYIAVAVLSLLLSADKEAALLYLLFFGYYPIVKSLIERITSRAAQYAIKLAVFNLCMVGEYFAAVKLFSVPEESYELFGFQLPTVLLLFMNFFFLVYDFLVTRIVTTYLLKWHDKVNKNTKL